MDKLPPSARRFFWDINPDDLDVAKHSRYVIERLLDYGDIAELRWLFGNFNRDAIIAVLKSSSRLSRRHALAWANYFDIPQTEIKCLSKLSQKQHVTTWTY